MSRASAIIGLLLANSLAPMAASDLADIAARAGAVTITEGSTTEWRQALATWRELLGEVERATDLGSDAAGDRELLSGYLEARIHQAEVLRPQARLPASYLALAGTASLSERPCGSPVELVEQAEAELSALPARLANARLLLERPPRPWTEAALEAATYAAELLREVAVQVCIDDPAAALRFKSGASTANEVVLAFQDWLLETILPRSAGPASWPAESLELLAVRGEGLAGYDLESALRLAEAEASAVSQRAFEAPVEPALPWSQALETARDEAGSLERWLKASQGFELAHGPDPPEALLTLQGAIPRIVFHRPRARPFDPLNPPLRGEALAEARALFTPAWTRIDAARGWFAARSARATADHPVRSLAASGCAAAGRALYLETWLIEAGYFAALPAAERAAVEAAVARRRLWVALRAIARIRLARGELDFDQAVERFREDAGIARTLAAAELRRAGSSLLPPACGLWRERLIRDRKTSLLDTASSLEELHQSS